MWGSCRLDLAADSCACLLSLLAAIARRSRMPIVTIVCCMLARGPKSVHAEAMSAIVVLSGCANFGFHPRGIDGEITTRWRGYHYLQFLLRWLSLYARAGWFVYVNGRLGRSSLGFDCCDASDSSFVHFISYNGYPRAALRNDKSMKQV